MFGKLGISSFKSVPEQFRLTIGFSSPDADPAAHRASDGWELRQESVSVDWLSSTTEAEVVQRVLAALDDPDVVSERVQATLVTAAASSPSGVVTASSFQNEINLRLRVQSSKPVLRSLELLRVSGSAAVSTTLGLSLWSLLDVGSVTRLRCTEGATSLWDERVLARFQALRVLNLSHAGLTSLPGVIGTLQHLQELRVVGNRLKVLPPELGRLHRLRVLAADANELVILPGELRRCTALEELTLDNNRLTSVLLNFAAFPRLQVLHLFNNPLEFLPEISPCAELRNLSVANLRITADRDFAQFQVELLQPTVAAATTINMSLFDSKGNDSLRPIFNLMLRRSSGHHPLLAGALRHLAEDPKNRDLMAKQENALQQLILMSLNDNEVVVEQTCKTLTLLALHSAALADAIVEADLGSMLSLLGSREQKLQLSSLRVLAAIGFASATASDNLLSDRLLTLLKGFACDRMAGPELRAAALEALGNLAFGMIVKKRLVGQHELMQTLHELATGGEVDSAPQRVRSAALRVLAILGENEAVWRVSGRQLVRGRGVRVLSMDGGGMKGMATVRMLRQLEARTGRRVHELFDLIVGTSTGGLLAVALGLRQFTLDDCEAIYKVLGQQVFSRAAVKDKEEGFFDGWTRAFHTSTQHVRAVVVGYKHDASVYEMLLKDYCDVAKDRRCLSDAMIDTACLNAPKVALVATLASASPATPFVFRNYELPPAAEQLRASMSAHKGSSKHAVWQAVRASSAAIYYLDDFTCGSEKFQDGAVVANNPAVVGLQEARLLWPDSPIDVFVSLSTGSIPGGRRDKGLSSFVDAGSILLESATSVDRVHEALATTLPLVPNLRYFRFNPVDPRCNMDLDEIDPAKWASLETAIDDYVAANNQLFDAAAAALRHGLQAGTANGPAQLRLGTRRGVVVVTAARSVVDPDAADVAAAACTRLPMCVGLIDLQADAEISASTDAVQSAARHKPTIELQSHPVSFGAQQPGAAHALQPQLPPGADASASVQPEGTQDAQATVVEVHLGSALGSVLGWFSPTKQPSPAGAASSDPPVVAMAGDDAPPSSQKLLVSPRGPAAGSQQSGAPPLGWPAGKDARQDDVLAELEARLEASRISAGIVHLALVSSTAGLVLRWQELFEAITEPSPAASELLLRAGYDPSAMTLSRVFEEREAISVDGSKLRVISRQSQRLMGLQLSVLLAQRTAPVATLDLEAIDRLRWALSGQLIVCTAVVAPDQVLALLKGGALAVVSLSGSAGDAVDRAGGRALAGFFAELYGCLEQGNSLVDSLAKASEAQPGLRSAFQAFALHGKLPVLLN